MEDRPDRAGHDADAARPSAERRLPIDDALAPYEDALRAQLPSMDEILAAAARRRRGKQRQRALAGGGTLAAVVAALLWLDPAYRTEQFATGVGERATWTLQDGSELRLNTATRVTQSLHLRSRRFTLERGEASFQVAHAPWRAVAPWAERSFSVRAGPVRVDDIGTIFNVRLLGPDAAQVTVLQGRVRVSRPDLPPGQEPDTPRELATGESLVGHAQGYRVPGATAAAQATSWQQGRLLFDNTPLREVLAEMQRYRRAPLVLDGRVDGDWRISGQFDIDRIEQLVGLLPQLAPVRLRRGADEAVRVEPAH